MPSTNEATDSGLGASPGAAEAIVFSLFLPDARMHPYPYYHRLRCEDPLHWNPLGFWLLTRYADGAAVLPDRRFMMVDPRDQQNLSGLPINQEALGTLQERLLRTMLFKNPPDHTRLRGLVSKAFTPRIIASLRLHIQEIVDELLTAAPEAGSIDLIADLAYPLPVIVIADLLGVPAEDRFKFRNWSRDLASAIDPILIPETVERASWAMGELEDYFRTLIVKRRGDLRNDLLSALIAAEEQGDRLSEDEMLANAILLLAVGHETTMNLIGNGTLALLRNPDQWEKLRSEPVLIQSAIEELLRYDSPVQMTGRKAGEDITIAGKTIRQGDFAIIIIGAANHDPDRFPDPDRLDITRSENTHLTFGGGVHYCLGASLARVEGQIAIGSLAQRFPNLQLHSDEPQWRETITLRGLKALPVTC
ncbi:MAG: cytochrome P450 [Candidatus Binatia bacterium]